MPTSGRRLLERGLIDEIDLHSAPGLLGDGIRLSDNPGGAPVRLRLLEVTNRQSAGICETAPTRRVETPAPPSSASSPSSPGSPIRTVRNTLDGRRRACAAHDYALSGGGCASCGLTARTTAECMPSATGWVGVIETSVNPAATRPARYSAKDRAPAMQPT